MTVVVVVDVSRNDRLTVSRAINAEEFLGKVDVERRGGRMD